MSRGFRASGLALVLVVAVLLATIISTPFSKPIQAAEAGRAECRSMPSVILGHPVSYCVVLPRGYDVDKTTRYPVLYFLHGLGGNEQELLESGGMNEIEDLRAANKIGEFLVVAPNGGRFLPSHAIGPTTVSSLVEAIACTTALLLETSPDRFATSTASSNSACMKPIGCVHCLPEDFS